MEIRQIIKKTINETLGVPDNIYETSVEISKSIIEKIKNLGSIGLEENLYNFKISGKFRIADYEFSLVDIHLVIHRETKITNPEMTQMSVATEGIKTSDFKVKNQPSSTVELNISFALPENYSSDKFYEFVLSEKSKIIESLSHELMHAYDHYKKPYDNVKNRALYDASVGKITGVFALDVFFHDIYYTLVNESLVRPSEIVAAIRNNDISQKEFIKFLYDTDTYKNLKRISKFTYEGFRENLMREMSIVDELLEEGDFDVKNMSDEEKIDIVLNRTKEVLSKMTIDNFRKIITSDFLEEIIGFQGEKERFFRKFVNSVNRFKNTEDFYRFYEKQFQYVANKMIKKISKLYATTKKSQNSQ